VLAGEWNPRVGVSSSRSSDVATLGRYELAPSRDARKSLICKAEFGSINEARYEASRRNSRAFELLAVIEEDSDVAAVVDPKEGYTATKMTRRTMFSCSLTKSQNRWAPIIDKVFPVEEGVLIGEPGRYFVAACATLCCRSLVRTNGVGDDFGTRGH
jgi:hypothetical protein